MVQELTTHWSPDVAVDVVLFTIESGVLKVVLVKRTHAPFMDIMALPGGTLKKGETTRDAAERIVQEKTSVKPTHLEQLYTFDAPGRDPRGQVVSVTYFGLLSAKPKLGACYDVEKLPRLAFDHENIVRYALQRLRYKLEYTNLALALLSKTFPFSAIQEIYEGILGKSFDKRNFRKKFLALGLIKETRKKLVGVRQRPAALYACKDEHVVELKRFF